MLVPLVTLPATRPAPLPHSGARPLAGADVAVFASVLASMDPSAATTPDGARVQDPLASEDGRSTGEGVSGTAEQSTPKSADGSAEDAAPVAPALVAGQRIEESPMAEWRDAETETLPEGVFTILPDAPSVQGETFDTAQGDVDRPGHQDPSVLPAQMPVDRPVAVDQTGSTMPAPAVLSKASAGDREGLTLSVDAPSLDPEREVLPVEAGTWKALPSIPSFEVLAAPIVPLHGKVPVQMGEAFDADTPYRATVTAVMAPELATRMQIDTEAGAVAPSPAGLADMPANKLPTAPSKAAAPQNAAPSKATFPNEPLQAMSRRISQNGPSAFRHVADLSLPEPRRPDQPVARAPMLPLTGIAVSSTAPDVGAPVLGEAPAAFAAEEAVAETSSGTPQPAAPMPGGPASMPLGIGHAPLSELRSSAGRAELRAAYDGVFRPAPQLPVASRMAEADSAAPPAGVFVVTPSQVPEQASLPGQLMPSAPRSDPLPLPLQALVRGLRDADSPVVEITLSPRELGKVLMRLTLADGAPVLNVQADRAETQELIRRNIDQLLQDFRAQGFDGVSVTMGDPRGQRRGAGLIPQALADHLPVSSEEVAHPAEGQQPGTRHVQMHGALDLRL